MLCDILDLFRRERVVDADGSAACVHEAQVGDHVLRHVARHDQAELPRAKSQPLEGHRHRGDLGAIAIPVEAVPLAVAFPA
jgi:hypothetical protein